MLARWRTTAEYHHLEGWRQDWDYYDCRDVVISWCASPLRQRLGHAAAAADPRAARRRQAAHRLASRGTRYDSIEQHGLALLRKTHSWRYETQARYLEEQFARAVLVDPDSGARYPIAEVRQSPAPPNSTRTLSTP